MMTGFERYTKKTRRAMFLEEMEQVVPWAKLGALIEPHYPKPGNGRRPKELEQMLRIYFLQQWFNLADPAVEEALYDSVTLRQFVGIDLGAEPVPDETTVCKFRHLLEEHHLGEEILGTVNLYLQAKGVRITTGTIVDATLIHAPSSTKNREQSRDPEMHQTKKGKEMAIVDMTSPAWQKSVTDERIVKVTVEGGVANGMTAAMPAHGDLKDQQDLQRGLVKLIRSLHD